MAAPSVYTPIGGASAVSPPTADGLTLSPLDAPSSPLVLRWGGQVSAGGRVGAAAASTNASWAFDGAAWAPLASNTTAPPPRTRHCAVLAGDRLIVLFGRVSAAEDVPVTPWALNLTDSTWAALPSGPGGGEPVPPTRSGAACFMRGNSIVYVGGESCCSGVGNSRLLLDDVGAYHLPTGTWRRVDATGAAASGPLPAYGAASAFVRSHDVALLHGGRLGSGAASATLRALLFDGRPDTAPGNGTFLGITAAWVPVAVEGSSPPRAFHAGAWLPHTQRFCAVGGIQTSSYGDTVLNDLLCAPLDAWLASVAHAGRGLAAGGGGDGGGAVRARARHAVEAARALPPPAAGRGSASCSTSASQALGGARRRRLQPGGESLSGSPSPAAPSPLAPPQPAVRWRLLQLPTAGEAAPKPRAFHALCAAPAGGQGALAWNASWPAGDSPLVLAGGRDYDVVFGDMWRIQVPPGDQAGYWADLPLPGPAISPFLISYLVYGACLFVLTVGCFVVLLRQARVATRQREVHRRASQLSHAAALDSALAALARQESAANGRRTSPTIVASLPTTTYQAAAAAVAGRTMATRSPGSGAAGPLAPALFGGGGNGASAAAPGSNDDGAARSRSLTSAFDPNEQDECAICLSAFKAGDVLRVLPCLHLFHLDEIDHWLLHSSTLCPLCKASVVAAAI